MRDMSVRAIEGRERKCEGGPGGAEPWKYPERVARGARKHVQDVCDTMLRHTRGCARAGCFHTCAHCRVTGRRDRGKG